MEKRFKILWYMQDKRFKPGTVADIGNIRLELRRTDREKNNKYRLYMMIRTRENHGVPHTLKRGVAVAQFSGKITLEKAQEEATAYLADFLGSILDDFEE